MGSIQKILLPTDFSEGSRPATEMAVTFARKFGATLTLLHVYSAPIYVGAFGEPYTLPIDIIERSRKDAAQALEQLRERLAGPDLVVETLAIEGLASDTIVAVARSNAIDLIVMGTHGRTGFKHFLLGSVAERVVRTAECPVLTVHSAPPKDAAPAGT